MLYEKTSAFSDEIAEDIDTQFTVLNKLGIKYFEPRGVNGKNISELNDEQVVELKAQMEKYGIKASSIGSPIGKIKITEDFADHFEKFKRVVKTAKMLDCKYIRMFSFFKDGDWTEEKIAEVMSRLAKFIEYAKEHPELTFLVTRIGCGIAGYKEEEVAPLFAEAKDISNIYLPRGFWNKIN